MPRTDQFGVSAKPSAIITSSKCASAPTPIQAALERRQTSVATSSTNQQCEMSDTVDQVVMLAQDPCSRVTGAPTKDIPIVSWLHFPPALPLLGSRQCGRNALKRFTVRIGASARQGGRRGREGVGRGDS